MLFSTLNSLVIATHAERSVATTIATTTSPAKGDADSLIFLKDASVLCSAARFAAVEVEPENLLTIQMTLKPEYP